MTPPAPAVSRVNDFVVKFANVNGSGSASANGLFAKAILRMGVPVAARNIFPSNIQGLPTWFEVRVVEAGWRGRRGGVDMAVAMNPQTWDKDLAEVDAGGYVFYDSTKPLPPSKLRADVTPIGVPLTAISNAEYSDPRQRQLFKNIIYLGALSALLDIDPAEIERLFGEQYKGKEALLESNRKALHLGRDYMLANFECPLPVHVKRSDKVGDRIFIDGNTASALGCVYGGATVAAWYPITPSSSLAEAFGSYCRKLRTDVGSGKKRYAIVQAEDELASIGMVIGAAWNGARAFTATSGPGVSLMQEFLGLAYFAEIPAVLFDVQRGSPSTGMPTRTQQADLLCCAYASHGDTKHILLFPEDPTESFEFAATAFDLADRLPDTDLRDAGPGHRHAGLADGTVRVGRRAPDGPRQGHDGGDARRGTRFRPLPRRRRRRRALPHLSGHACVQGRLLHPRHHQGPLRAVHGGGAGVRRQHAAAAAQVRDGQGRGARAGDPAGAQAREIRRHLVRFHRRGDERIAGGTRGRRAFASTACASAHFRSRMPSRISSTRTSTSSSSSRIATRR